MEKEPSFDEFEESSLLLHMDLLSDEFDEPSDDEASKNDEPHVPHEEETLQENREEEKQAKDAASLFPMEMAMDMSLELSDGNDMELDHLNDKICRKDSVGRQEIPMGMSNPTRRVQKKNQLEVRDFPHENMKITTSNETESPFIESKPNKGKMDIKQPIGFADGIKRKKVFEKKKIESSRSSMGMVEKGQKKAQGSILAESTTKNNVVKKREWPSTMENARKSSGLKSIGMKSIALMGNTSFMEHADSMNMNNGMELKSSMGADSLENRKKDKSMNMDL